MAKNVYPLPASLHSAIQINSPYRVQSEIGFDGNLISQTELEPRFTASLSGPIHKNNRVALETFADRLSGGIGLAALWDQSLRRTLGWSGRPALNSSGVQFWRSNGQTSTYAGESAGATWRLAIITGSGSSGSTSLSLTGMLANEPVVAGAPIRIGNYRYIIATATTANGSGAATVTLARPLRAAVSGSVTLPGDLFVADLVKLDMPNFDVSQMGEFKVTFREVFEAEVSGGFTWVV